jgi:pentose-5-phosphate-3-epimerase
MGKLSASILGADLAHVSHPVKAVAGVADVIPIDVLDAHARGISSSDDVVATTADVTTIVDAA